MQQIHIYSTSKNSHNGNSLKQQVRTQAYNSHANSLKQLQVYSTQHISVFTVLYKQTIILKITNQWASSQPCKLIKSPQINPNIPNKWHMLECNGGQTCNVR